MPINQLFQRNTKKKFYATFLKFNLGFSLAEVLITLCIIGTVAVITTPILQKNIQDYQLKQAWKKEFSTISLAFESLLQDNNGNISGVYSFPNNFILDLGKKLKYTKYCPAGSGSACLPNGYKNMASGSSADPRGCGLPSQFVSSNDYPSVIILSDGNFIINNFWYKNCDYSNALVNNNNACSEWASFLVDVNGAKEPNTLGKDLFAIQVYGDRLIPSGAKVQGYTGSNYCASDYTCKSDGSGVGCSYEYLYK